MGLTYGNLNGSSVTDYELTGGNATINFKVPVQTIAANATGTQSSGTLLPTGCPNVAVTSGGSAYSVTLPPATAGAEIDILCITGTNTVTVFPAPGQTINALSANTGLAMGALTSATFLCVIAGAWYTSPRVPS